MVIKLSPLRTLTKSRNRSLVIWSSFSNDSLMCWQFSNVSLSPLHKGMKTWRIGRDSTTFWKCQISYEIVVHHKLRISYKLSYLRTSRVLRVLSDLYFEHHWLYIKCSNSNIFLCNCVCLEVSCFCFEHWKSLACVFEYLNYLACVFEHL